MEWGFYHFGRFSNQYKRISGRLPGATQKKAAGETTPVILNQ
jgi:hypothetical protein